MLHSVPESQFRTILLEVVAMQQTLLQDLCSLPEGSSVNPKWLAKTWSKLNGHLKLDTDWCRRFWENDNGQRAMWCNTIAASKISQKRALHSILDEHLRFAELYKGTPALRLTVPDWNGSPLMMAAKLLLKAFYAPLFYEGYPVAEAAQSKKPGLTAGKLDNTAFMRDKTRTCPYLDESMGDAVLDHFLPKDQFPILSCHPDNLIPCSNASNRGGRKGIKKPLDLEAADQAANWFHPRLRTGQDSFQLRIVDCNELGLCVKISAVDAMHEMHVKNMSEMFQIEDHWSEHIDPDIMHVGELISGDFRFERAIPTEELVRQRLQGLLRHAKMNIRIECLSYRKVCLYEHILTTPSLFSNVLSRCVDDAKLTFHQSN